MPLDEEKRLETMISVCQITDLQLLISSYLKRKKFAAELILYRNVRIIKKSYILVGFHKSTIFQTHI